MNSDSEFTPVPKGIDLDAIFVVKDYRKIRTDHTFSYGNKFYLIESPLRHSIAKQKIEIRTNHEKGFTAYFADRKLEVSEVIEPTNHQCSIWKSRRSLRFWSWPNSWVMYPRPQGSVVSLATRSTVTVADKEGGIQALKRQINEDHIHANRTDQETAEVIIEFSLDNPHLGQVQVSNHLKQSNHIDISASGVRQVWLRENMQTIALRMQKRSEMQELI